MNKTHGSRKQDIERHIIIALFKGDIKRAIDIAQKYNISPKDFGKLSKKVKEVKEVG